MSDLLEAAKNAVRLAQKKGAQEASASSYRSRDVEVGWRDGKVEKVSEATTRGVSVALYVDGRYSAVSSSDLRPEALERFIEESVAMARTLAKDPFRKLPDPKLYEGRAALDLQVHDSKAGEVTATKRKELAAALEDAARSQKPGPSGGEMISVETAFSDSEGESARVTSNGFEGETRSTSFWLSAGATIKDPDGRRPAGHAAAGSRFFSELPNAKEIGELATKRAYEQVGAAKIKSLVGTIVVENRVAGRLLRALLGPLSARALQQKQSFMEESLGKPIASKLLTVVDEPHLIRAFGSRLFDGDGFATKKRTVIEAGVLKTFFIDDYYGRKLGKAPTTGSSTNLTFALGKKSETQIVADVKDGVFVTGFLGGNSNSTTGDYSFGIQGFRIEGGKLTQPLSEMNISGTQQDLWKALSAVGNDPYPYTSVLTPTMVFDGISIAGA